MKIFAGLKFQRRKPRAAPSVAAPSVCTSIWWLNAADIVKKPAATAEIPAQRPSIWSRMLNAAVMPTTQNTVKKQSENHAGPALNKFREEMGADAGRQQEARAGRACR